MTSDQSSRNTATIIVVGLTLVLIMWGLATCKEAKTAAVSNSVSTVASPAAPLAQSSHDYDSGFTRGRAEGIDHANSGAGMPLPHGMEGMANLFSRNASARDVESWRHGFKDGFVDGFKSVKDFRRNEADWEQLSWSNASLGRRLYEYDGTHRATIVRIDRASGLIVVRYVDGTVEPKLLAYVARSWWVRR